MSLSKIQFRVIFFTILLVVCSGFYVVPLRAQSDVPSLIPLPKNLTWFDGKFLISDKTRITSQSSILKDYLTSQIKIFSGLDLTPNAASGSGNIISLKVDPAIDPITKEAYKLSVSKNQITIASSYEEGILRGLQTFFQLIPPSIKVLKNKKIVEINCCTISDKPEFPWRGLNLDCCRHFMSKDFVKRYIDILAYYKFNRFHWHLTEDQGWRIEIKKYPKLTKIGAWRTEADGSVYGGFYTQDDIREIVAYANSRFITIVPEIEMPGHCQASLASYPENSCTGGPFKVATTWGVFKDIYCPGRDSTFIFLENILDEVIQLFPGEYIHIGGDEAPKNRWKECPLCQARIKGEGLKDENELQSWFTKRIAAYLAGKRRKVIGWDEVLQGGAAPNIIVQSWQNFQGAINAARLGHYTICSPESHTYFDKTAENLDLKTVYSFNPVPDSIKPEERKYVLGGEANLWAENIPQEKVDNFLFPRMLALSEVFWDNPQNKDYNDFFARVQRSYSDLSALGINYGIESKVFDYKTSFDNVKNEFIVKINTLQKKGVVRFTTDGKQPDSSSTLCTAQIIIDKPCPLKIASFYDNHLTGSENTLSFVFHKALNSKVALTDLYADQYSGGGIEALTDGIKGTSNFHDGLWQGYLGVDFEGIIDLGTDKEISKVSPTFLSDVESWIFLPNSVEISLSNDNINYHKVASVSNSIPLNNTNVFIKDFAASFNSEKARFVKVKAVSIKTCPSWHSGAGGKCWLFIDEIVVE